MVKKQIDLQVLEVTQQIGTFYIGKITAEEIVELSYSDVRKLTEERDLESYLGIQRPLNRTRAKDIQEYVKNIDATFPTGILLSIENDNASFNEVNSTLSITFPPGTSPAKILDGQHRIAGFMNIDTGEAIKELCWFEQDGKEIPFELVVTIFVGLDLAEQANIFATVNIKQTKVSKSLVYDLESYSKTRSPQKTAHEIILALAKHPKSPFRGKIKRLGKKEGEHETITQAALVEEVISLISKNAMQDRDYLLRKEKGSFSRFRKGLSRSNYEDGLVFRNAFIDGEDHLILKTLTAFFLSVEKKWPKSWEKGNKKSLLNRTVGIYVLFRLLKAICKTIYLDDDYRVIGQDEFSRYLDKIKIDDGYFDSLDAKTSTVSKLYKEFEKWMENSNYAEVTD